MSRLQSRFQISDRTFEIQVTSDEMLELPDTDGKYIIRQILTLYDRPIVKIEF